MDYNNVDLSRATRLMKIEEVNTGVTVYNKTSKDYRHVDRFKFAKFEDLLTGEQESCIPIEIQRLKSEIIRKEGAKEYLIAQGILKLKSWRKLIR